MPCLECGASVARNERELHVCDSERRLDYALLQLRGEVEHFDDQLAAYLRSPWGRFEVWYAAQRR
jgi:hypothetical protein